MQFSCQHDKIKFVIEKQLPLIIESVTVQIFFSLRFRLIIQNEIFNLTTQIMNKKSQHKISTDEQSDNDLNCSCEILNDTDLENISDSDCSCSECLQANLNAFNEFKDAEEREKLKEARSLDKIPSKKNQRNTNQQRTLRDKSLNRYGRDSKVNLNQNTISKINPLNGQETIMHEGDQKQHSKRKNYFTQQNINDYILITKQRTRQYLNQRNKISKENTKLKQEFKQKIKENLQILKYTVKSLQQHKPNGYQHQDIKSSRKPFHKWNHTPLISREILHIRANKKECKQKLNDRRNKRQKVDTNLQNLIPQFSSNPSQFLEQVKQKRLQKLKPCKGCPHDHCPNHHMRTSKQRLLQIEQFIKDKVAKYNEKKKQQKIKKEESRKMKQAKLRAIDLKCKQILKRSKKYDPSESRTSFHLTIDHFSTFSELRAHKKEKEEQRQHNKEVRKMIKQQKKGGRLEQAIYQDVLEDYNPPLESDIKPEPKKTVPKLPQKQYCEKITKEARINSPRKLKPDDEEYKKQKREKQKNPMSLNEQKKKTKEIALQIQRKKRQLMEEYKRQQEMKQAKNEKLKNKHKQSLMHSNF